MRLLLLLVAPIVAFCQDAGIQKSLLQDTGDKALERSYLLYVPENLHRQPALVVVMHGYSSSSENIMRYSGMNEIASTQGFIVAYPQGTIDHKGNAFFNVGYAFHRDLVIDDLSFIKAMVTNIINDYGVNPKKIFATGMSNGGDMSYLLACEASSIFRAVAPIAGSMLQETVERCLPERKVPIMAVSGTKDPVTLYAGDPENNDGWGAYIGQEETKDFWLELYGLRQSSLVKINDSHKPLLIGNSTIELERYSGQHSEAEFWFYRVDNGGHDWPGAKIESNWQPMRYIALWAMGFGKNRDINTSQTIWQFFSQWIALEEKKAPRRPILKRLK